MFMFRMRTALLRIHIAVLHVAVPNYLMIHCEWNAWMPVSIFMEVVM
jgi:hypothetical protein